MMIIISTLLDHHKIINLDTMGNMYVADIFNHHTQAYLDDQSNRTINADILDKVENDSSMFNYSDSIVLDNQLSFYATDSFNYRIQTCVRY
ncbi:unnamed protein product [Rotaria magnacalcarata]|uniref:Uncharacterized protein n=2 Tax=Rotaria magnacalcarata TaxID=392030 RepID=A0A819LGG6_9BILA|nr:unnamed protein product [Rotaria magnacalcarata]CAF3964267.1 unnamed protein product [Rotaria magnacalcarata]